MYRSVKIRTNSPKSPRRVVRYASLLLTLVAASAVFAGTPTVSLIPGELYLQPGEACTLQVVVDDAFDSLSCVEVRLSFDSAVLGLEAGLEGELYTSSLFSTFFDWELEDPDTVLAVDCVLGYRSYIVAPGELVSFVFEAVGEGFTVVGICQVTLWDIDRNELDVDIGSSSTIHVSTVSGEGDTPGAGASLYNYPNPFNPSTTISIDLPRQAGNEAAGYAKEVEIGVFDAAGHSVAELFKGPLGPGIYSFQWNGRRDSGRPAVSGIYFALARIEELTLKRKLVLLR